MPARRLPSSLLVAALLGVPLVAQPQPDPRPPGQDTASAVLTGRVVRADDGRPVPDAIVRCQRPAEFHWGCWTGWTREVPSTFEQLVTDADGRYRFVFQGGLRRGSIVVLPTAETGAWFVAIPGEGGHRNWLHAGETVDVETAAPAPTRLSGRVVDELGHGFAGARVLVWHFGRALGVDRRPVGPESVVVADEHGNFVVPSSGSYAELEAEADGCVAEDRLSVHTRPGNSVERLTLTLHQARFVSGVVVDSDGVPMANVYVQVSRGRIHGDGQPTATKDVTRQRDLLLGCRSDAEGHFRLGPLPHNEVDVVANRPPDVPWTQKLIPGGEPLHIVLEAGASLSGVVRGANGLPLHGAGVQTLAHGGARVLTGGDGAYRFTGVPESSAALIAVTADGHALHVMEGIEIGPSGAQTLDVQLEAAAPLAGRILDHQGRPLVGGTVSIHGDREIQRLPERSLMWRKHGFEHPSWEEHFMLSETRTDEAGTFRFEQLYRGRFLLRVGDPPQAFWVSSGEDEMELRLSPPDELRRRLVGTVVDARTGAPLEGYDVEAQYSTMGREPDPLRKDRGRFVLDLFTGNVRVIVGARGRAYWVSSFDGEDAGDFEMQVPLPVGRRVEVSVVDARHEPVAQAAVHLICKDQTVIFEANAKRSWGTVVTGPSGSFVAERLPPEVLTLVVERRSGEGTASIEVARVTVDLTDDGCQDVVELVVPDQR